MEGGEAESRGALSILTLICVIRRAAAVTGVYKAT